MDFLEPILKSIQGGLVYVMALAALGAVIMLGVFMRNRVMSLLSKHFIREEILNLQKVQELLVAIRVKCNSDRAAIFMFHNGDKFTNGSPILKISAAYETVSAGISGHGSDSTNILVSTVPEAVDFLTAGNYENHIYFKKVDTLEPCHYKATLEAQGVESVAKFPLHNGTDIIGFVCLDFVKSDPAKDEFDFIKSASTQIELMLNAPEKKNILQRLFKGRKK